MKSKFILIPFILTIFLIVLMSLLPKGLAGTVYAWYGCSSGHLLGTDKCVYDPVGKKCQQSATYNCAGSCDQLNQGSCGQETAGSCSSSCQWTTMIGCGSPCEGSPSEPNPTTSTCPLPASSISSGCSSCLQDKKGSSFISDIKKLGADSHLSWDSCSNDQLVSNWCSSIDSSGCASLKSGACQSSCGGSSASPTCSLVSGSPQAVSRGLTQAYTANAGSGVKTTEIYYNYADLDNGQDWHKMNTAPCHGTACQGILDPGQIPLDKTSVWVTCNAYTSSSDDPLHDSSTPVSPSTACSGNPDFAKFPTFANCGDSSRVNVVLSPTTTITAPSAITVGQPITFNASVSTAGTLSTANIWLAKGNSSSGSRIDATDISGFDATKFNCPDDGTSGCIWYKIGTTSSIGNFTGSVTFLKLNTSYVVIASAEDTEKDSSGNALACSANPYVSKPFTKWGKTYSKCSTLGADVVYVSTPAPLTCDFNGSNSYDDGDIALWEAVFQGTDTTHTADCSDDGKADLVDFNRWRNEKYLHSIGN